MSGFNTLDVDISTIYRTQSQVLNLYTSSTTSSSYTLANTANSTANTANSTANNSYNYGLAAYNNANSANNTANGSRNSLNGLPYISNSGSNTFFTWYLHFNAYAIGGSAGTGSQALFSRYTGNFGGYYTIGTTSSSIKTKTNVYDITPEESAQVYKMRPVKFNFKDDLEKECIGFIAEEMFELEPRVVPYNIVDGVKEPVSINYEHLVPLLVAEIKNLKKCIDELNIELNKKIDN